MHSILNTSVHRTGSLMSAAERRSAQLRDALKGGRIRKSLLLSRRLSHEQTAAAAPLRTAAENFCFMFNLQHEGEEVVTRLRVFFTVLFVSVCVLGVGHVRSAC